MAEGITNYGSPGIRSTGAYLIGARPFILKETLAADTTYKVIFPYVTRYVEVILRDAGNDDVTLAFASSAVAMRDHGILLDTKNQSFFANVRTNAIYLKTEDTGATVDVTIFAELTDINADRFGDGWTGKGVDTDLSDGAVGPLEIVAL